MPRPRDRHPVRSCAGRSGLLTAGATLALLALRRTLDLRTAPVLAELAAPRVWPTLVATALAFLIGWLLGWVTRRRRPGRSRGP